MKFLIVYVGVVLVTLVSCQNNVPTCSIEGENYTTFDGKKYSFSGDRDAHYLIKDENFIVEIDNKCHGVCSKVPRALIIRVQHLELKLHSGAYYANGKKNRGLGWERHDIAIYRKPNNVIKVDLSNDIRIEWKEGSHVTIELPTSKAKYYMMKQREMHRYKGMGMCGIYNNDPSDDFTCPRGITVSSVDYFANEWRTKDDELPAKFKP